MLIILIIKFYLYRTLVLETCTTLTSSLQATLSVIEMVLPILCVLLDLSMYFQVYNVHKNILYKLNFVFISILAYLPGFAQEIMIPRFAHLLFLAISLGSILY